MTVSPIGSTGGGDFLGVTLAAFAAALVATQAICIRQGSREGRTTNALVVVLAVNVAVLTPAAAVTYFPAYSLTPLSVAAFAATGVVGTILGRACYYASINRIGASRTEPIKASQPLHATLIAVLLLGESVSLGHLAGIVCIVLGVAWITRETTRDRPAGGSERKWLWLMFPLGAAFLYGVEPTLAKVGFREGTPLLVGLSLKTITAIAGAIAYLQWRGVDINRPSLNSPSTLWFTAAGIANTLFLLTYYAALELTDVVVVVPIIQTSPLVIAVLSWLFLPRLERVTWQVVAAASVVVLGAGTVTIYG
ncbi:EamA family transporter [Halosolutus amylolyticus]|uniref:EamA family transporter n=1 Tax=Halosolutus amylolyticus TaxID=2932267 RepID=A0ABD5PJB2_9EURY|nr:EamA family transporter [Halosolutus amylolyticus]